MSEFIQDDVRAYKWDDDDLHRANTIAASDTERAFYEWLSASSPRREIRTVWVAQVRYLSLSETQY